MLPPDLKGYQTPRGSVGWLGAGDTAAGPVNVGTVLMKGSAPAPMGSLSLELLGAAGCCHCLWEGSGGVGDKP